MKRIVKTALAFVSASASAAIAQPIEPAAVVHIWTPDREIVRTFGQTGPDGTSTSPDHRFYLASTTKTLLAVSLLQAQEQDLLLLDDPAIEWLDDDIARITSLSDDVTVRHLLEMRSGVHEYITDRYFDDWRNQRPATRTVRGSLTYVPRRQPAFEAGTEYQYINTNYLLAQLVLENAANTSMAHWFTENIFAPAGMKNSFVFGSQGGPSDIVTGWDDLDEDGTPEPVSELYSGHGFGDGAVGAPARDLVAFYKALFVDRMLLGDGALKELVADPQDDGYGLGIVITGQPGGPVYSHAGAFAGFVADAALNTANNAVVVALIADGEGDTNELINEVLNDL